MTAPTVTVAMSVYNNAPYVGEAIDSILVQSFRDFAFLIINDGSTDGSGEVIDGSRIPPPESKASDELCLIDLEEGWYSLTDTEQKVGFALEWDLEMFPYVWFWQVFGGGVGWPWYGRTYNCALEPWSGYPLCGLTETIKHGSQKRLGPDASATTWLKAVAHSGASRVAKVEDGIVTSA